MVAFPVGDMMLVTLPGTDAVAVADMQAGFVLERLRQGACRSAVAQELSARTGMTLSSALAEVTALHEHWNALARIGGPCRHGPAVETAPEPVRPGAAPALDTVCQPGAAPVRLRVWPRRLGALVGAVTASCRAAEAPAGDDALPIVEGHATRAGYSVRVNGRPRLLTGSLMLARSEVLRHLALASHRDRDWMAVLHGAGIAGPAGAALLCGESGAGKSTLAGFLLAAGLALVTDDYAPLEVGTGHLWPVRFGLSVKEGSWPLLSPWFPDLATAPTVTTRHRRQRYVCPPRVATAPQPVRCLIFPRYEAGSALRLTRLEPGEALRLCAGSGGWFESSPERVGAFARWLAATPAFAMVHGDTDEAVATVRRLIEG